MLLYEQIRKSDQNGIVVTSTKDLTDIVLKLRTIAAEDRFNSIVNLANKTSAVFDAKEKFNSILEEEHPSLKGAELEFSIHGDEIMITGGKINGVEISKNTISDIEKLMNGNQGRELKDAMISFREEAIINFNRYTDSGRKNPIDTADFDKRFGGFSSYLDAFKNTSDNSKTIGPNDPNITRQAYFANASSMMASRLFN